jgi:hypothetical protein
MLNASFSTFDLETDLVLGHATPWNVADRFRHAQLSRYDGASWGSRRTLIRQQK